MKKLLLSCAVAALAMPAFAGSVNDILGTYNVSLELMADNDVKPVNVEGVTITQTEGNNVLISSNVFPFLPDLQDIPAVYDPDANTLTVATVDIVAGDYETEMAHFYDINGDDYEFEWLDAIVFNIDKYGYIMFPEDTATEEYGAYVYNSSIGQYAIYIFWGVEFEPVEVGGGDEPGDEPGTFEAITIDVNTDQTNTNVVRFDTGALTWGDPSEFPGTGFYAKLITLSNPEVTITCVNGNLEDEPGINNIGSSDGLYYDLYSANAGNGQLALYKFEVEDGYVIKTIQAYLNGGGSVTWTYEDDEFINDGSEFLIHPNTQQALVTAVASDGAVSATTWEDFVIVVMDEESAAGVKNVEVNDADAPVVYYDLQGRKVNNPSNGLFIRKQGSKSTKVVIR